jgi:hypothetical protein
VRASLSANSLLFRENTGNVRDLRRPRAHLRRKEPGLRAVFVGIPYAREQGILQPEQGIIAPEQGIFYVQQEGGLQVGPIMQSRLHQFSKSYHPVDEAVYTMRWLTKHVFSPDGQSAKY